MGKRSRLFASAAFPLLSFSLVFEPAVAAALREQPIAPLNNGIVGTAGATASFEVAQQEAPAAQPEEEQLKHKKPAEGEQGEPQGQKHEGQKPEGGAEPQHQMKQAEPEAAPKPQKQPQPEAQPPKVEHQQQPAEQEQPKPQKQPAAEAPPEPKKQRQQPAEEAQPEAQPQAKPQPKAVAPEAEPEAPQPKHKGKQPEAKQPAEAPQPKVEQQPAEETQPEAKPQPKAKPEPKAQQPAPAQKEAPATAEPQTQQEPAKQAQPDQNAHPKKQGQPEAPAQQPAEQPQTPSAQPPKGQKTPPATQEQPEAQPGTQVAPGTEQGQKPGDKTHGKQPQGQQQGEQPAANPQQPGAKGEPQGQPAQPGNQATPQTGKQQPANGAETPAQGNATPPAANGGQQAGEIQVPPAEQVSPQELERRKKIAENPGSASGPVILPVENGSAVLDSQKDSVRRGEHLNGGQNPGGQGGRGQGGQGQNGQGQNGQAQNNPAQQPPPAYTKPPTSDADAQRVPAGGQQQPPVKIEAVTSEQGRRIDRRPDFVPPQGTTIQTIINQDNRTIVNVDNNYVVRHDDTDRFVRGGERPTYEQLPRDRYRETIDQPNGDRIITIRNRYGDIIQRSRIDARGREYVLFYSPDLEQRPDHDDYFRDPGDDLPPMRLLIPLSQYIIDTASNRNANYYDFLREPPVEPVERIYSVNEVRYSARIRDKIRRIDLDTITFATGSADIPMTQASTLRGVADGISKVIQRDPTETFLIEGHTDAVGSAQSNLILSDRRAESVANVLTDVYGIPAENLVTQGYGEQYLKVNTTGPSQENRRVTIRRITPLVRPVAKR